MPIIIEFSFTSYKKPHLQHRIHTYRCPTVAFLMLAFVIASLIAAFRQRRDSGLISGVCASIVQSIHNVNIFWKLALDTILFLTFPFREGWSGNTWVWWLNKCGGLLQGGRQMSKSSAHAQSQEDLHGIQLRDVSTSFVAGDDESSIGLAK